MLDAEAFIASIIAHSDPDYNPKKAHEYYLRTRILQGKMDRKKNGKKGTGSRSSTNTAARAKLTSQRRAALQGAASSHEQAVARLRATGERRGNEIRAKLEAALKLITTQHNIANAMLTKQTYAKIVRSTDAKRDSTRQATLAAKEKMANDMRASIEKAKSDYQLKSDSIRNGFKSKLDSNSNQSDTGEVL